MKLFKRDKSTHTEGGVVISAQRRQIMNASSSFAVREAYKLLRTNIVAAIPGDKCKCFCVTSSAEDEGKSLTALNLAISCADAGKKVLLIDADMHRPMLAQLLQMKNDSGLSSVLSGEAEVEDLIQRGPRPTLDMLFSGEMPENPSGLIGNGRMKGLVEKMSQEYDCILVDTPPVNAVLDACVIANMLDGVLYLVCENKTDKEEVRHGINRLRLVGARILGFVLNGAKLDDRKKYYETYQQ